MFVHFKIILRWTLLLTLIDVAVHFLLVWQVGDWNKLVVVPDKFLLHDLGIYSYPNWWNMARMPMHGICLMLIASYTKIITKSPFFEFEDIDQCSVELPRDRRIAPIAHWYTVRHYDPLTSLYWVSSWFIVVLIVFGVGMNLIGANPKGLSGVANIVVSSTFISTSLFVIYFALNIIFSNRFWRYMKGQS